jgi:hypothetical protein
MSGAVHASWLPSDRTLHTLRQVLVGIGLNGTAPESVEPTWRGLVTRVVADPTQGTLEAELARVGLSSEEVLTFGRALALRDPDHPTPPAGSAADFLPQSARQLMATTFPPLLTIVPELIYEGTTLICGSPKVGKSVLMVGLALAVAGGGRALGTIPCAATGVLYLALEDGPRRLQRRIAEMWPNEPVPAGLTFVYRCPKLGAGLIERLSAYLDAHPTCTLVVIDTLAKVRGRAGTPGGMVYQQDYDELEPLTTLAQERRVAIVVVHHTRKAHSDDPMDMVNATQGAGGSVDSVLVLQRTRNGDGSATLTAMGRDLEESAKGLAFDPITHTYGLVGDAADVLATSARKAILAALQAASGPLSAREVADATGQRYDDVRQRLFQMADAGAVTRPERGKYGVPAWVNPNNPNNGAATRGGVDDAS